MRFKFIDAAKENFPITRLCQVLNISPSGYFAWRSRPASPCQQYCLIEYRAELRKHGIQISVSGKGNRFDNAVVETFSRI